MIYKKPKWNLSPFTCPHCNIVSLQRWYYLTGEIRTYFEREDTYPQNYGIIEKISADPYFFAKCDNCGLISVWAEEKMLYPDKANVPSPNSDLNKKMRELYIEASQIFNYSPRGSAALLRLVLEMLCKKIGATDDKLPDGDKKLKDRIKYLVKEKGLDPDMELALHSVRLADNSAVHAGELDLADNKTIALKLFDMINIISDDLITKKEKIRKLYGSITNPKPKQ
ncbi:MAG: DUF4145 domain-containing protein [Candidatus Heimdallarchaeota archaeon]